MTGSFPWQSPYTAFDNKPIVMNDPKGLAAENTNDPPVKGSRGNFSTVLDRARSARTEAQRVKEPAVPYASSTKQVLTSIATGAGVQDNPAVQAAIGAGSGMGTIAEAYNMVAHRANTLIDNPRRIVTPIDLIQGGYESYVGLEQTWMEIKDGDITTISETTVHAIKADLGDYAAIRSGVGNPKPTTSGTTAAEIEATTVGTVETTTAETAATQGTGNSSSVLLNTTKQLHAKFKHAVDFGIEGNYSRTNSARYSSAKINISILLEFKLSMVHIEDNL